MNTWIFPDTHHPLVFYLRVSITSDFTSVKEFKVSIAAFSVSYIQG